MTDKRNYLNTDLSFSDRARDLVARMTLEEKVSQMMHDSPAIERLGVPAYNWWNECLHGVARAGVATVFPQAIGMAAMWDVESDASDRGRDLRPRAARSITRRSGREIRASFAASRSGRRTSTSSATRAGAGGTRPTARTRI